MTATVGEQTQLVDERAERRRSRGGRGGQASWLTERDVALMSWIARWRFASVPQLRARFGLGQTAAYRRLGRLADLGCVELRRVFVGRPGVYVVTDAGLGLCEVDLPKVGVDLRTYRHDSALVDLATSLELRGLDVLSERELRRADAGASAPRHAVLLGGEQADGRPRRHYPDIVVGREGQARFAVELELAAKRVARLREILTAYRRASHLSAVVYYVEQPAVRRRLELLRDELRMGDRLDLRSWTEGAPDG